MGLPVWARWYCMVWMVPPYNTPCAAIGTTRWWHLDRAPAELRVLPGCQAEPSAQTESVPSALVRRWVSFPRAPGVAELRACAIPLCLERQPPSSASGRGGASLFVARPHRKIGACSLALIWKVRAAERSVIGGRPGVPTSCARCAFETGLALQIY
jgi:hypothetical protein